MKIRKPRTKNGKIIALGIASVLIIGGGVIFYKLFIEKPEITTVPSTSQSDDAEAIKSGTSQKNANSQQASGQSDKQSGGASSSGAPASPQGNFVNTYTVTSLGATMESLCITTVGATCEITFTKGGVTKSVGKMAVNDRGTAIWTWTPESISLTSGTWEIKAVASQNNLQTSAKDPRNLEVTP